MKICSEDRSPGRPPKMALTTTLNGESLVSNHFNDSLTEDDLPEDSDDFELRVSENEDDDSKDDKKLTEDEILNRFASSPEPIEIKETNKTNEEINKTNAEQNKKIAVKIETSAATTESNVETIKIKTETYESNVETNKKDDIKQVKTTDTRSLEPLKNVDTTQSKSLEKSAVYRVKVNRFTRRPVNGINQTRFRRFYRPENYFAKDVVTFENGIDFSRDIVHKYGKPLEKQNKVSGCENKNEEKVNHGQIIPEEGDTSGKERNLGDKSLKIAQDINPKVVGAEDNFGDDKLKGERLESNNPAGRNNDNLKDTKLEEKSIRDEDPHYRNLQDVNHQNENLKDVNIEDKDECDGQENLEQNLEQRNPEDKSLENETLQQTNVEDTIVKATNLDGVKLADTNLEDPNLEDYNLADKNHEDNSGQDENLKKIELQDDRNQDKPQERTNLAATNYEDDPAIDNILEENAIENTERESSQGNLEVDYEDFGEENGTPEIDEEVSMDFEDGIKESDYNDSMVVDAEEKNSALEDDCLSDEESCTNLLKVIAKIDDSSLLADVAVEDPELVEEPQFSVEDHEFRDNEPELCVGDAKLEVDNSKLGVENLESGVEEQVSSKAEGDILAESEQEQLPRPKKTQVKKRKRKAKRFHLYRAKRSATTKVHNRSKIVAFESTVDGDAANVGNITDSTNISDTSNIKDGDNSNIVDLGDIRSSATHSQEGKKNSENADEKGQDGENDDLLQIMDVQPSDEMTSLVEINKMGSNENSCTNSVDGVVDGPLDNEIPESFDNENPESLDDENPGFLDNDNGDIEMEESVNDEAIGLSTNETVETVDKENMEPSDKEIPHQTANKDLDQLGDEIVEPLEQEPIDNEVREPSENEVAEPLDNEVTDIEIPVEQNNENQEMLDNEVEEGLGNAISKPLGDTIQDSERSESPKSKVMGSPEKDFHGFSEKESKQKTVEKGLSNMVINATDKEGSFLQGQNASKEVDSVSIDVDLTGNDEMDVDNSGDNYDEMPMEMEDLHNNKIIEGRGSFDVSASDDTTSLTNDRISGGNTESICDTDQLNSNPTDLNSNTAASISKTAASNSNPVPFNSTFNSNSGASKDNKDIEVVNIIDNDTVEPAILTTKSNKRQLSADSSDTVEESAKKMRLSTDNDKVKHRLTKLTSLQEYLIKKKLKSMTPLQLEEFVLLKICEALASRSEIAELKHQLQMQEQIVDQCKKDVAQVMKQARDLQLVQKKLLQELKTRRISEKPIIPVKITRSVGLQAYIDDKRRFSRPNSVVGANPPGTATPSPVKTVQASRTPNSTSSATSCSGSLSGDVGHSNTPTNVVPRQITKPSPQRSQLQQRPQIPPRITSNPPPTVLNQSQKLNQPPKASPAVKANQPIKMIQPVKSNQMAKNNQTNQAQVQKAAVIDLTDEDDKVTKSVTPAPQARTVPIGNKALTTVLKNNMTKVVPGVAVSSGQRVLVVPAMVASKPGSTVMFKVNSGQANGIVTSSQQAMLVSSNSPSNRQPQQKVQTLVMRNVVAPKLVVTHPAPLPLPPPGQYRKQTNKPLPPKPHLTITKSSDGSGILLQWKMPYNLSNYESIASYQLYAYQETSEPPRTEHWGKIGDVKALALPMAVTLTQFATGHRYYFAVRAVDVHERLGAFSEPQTIML